MIEYQCVEDNTFNDKWLIERAFPGKRGGFYIEAGAATGVKFSSSYCLEQHFDWQGVSIEPVPSFYDHFVAHRKNPCINAALASKDGKAPFAVDATKYLSGLMRNTHSKPDSQIMEIDTISFPTLLRQCPHEIDFISMDIEGSELEALSVFPFDKYQVACFIVEGIQVTELLTNHGYVEIRNPFNTEAPWERYFWLQRNWYL